MEHEEYDDPSIRIKARIHAEEVLDEICYILQIERKDLPIYLETVKWVIGLRAGSIRVQWAIALAVLAVAMSGIVAAFWEGVKHAVKGN